MDKFTGGISKDSFKSNLSKIVGDQRIVLIFVLIAFSAVVTIINPRFLTVNNLVLIFQQISIVGVLTMAMSILMLAGNVDLSIGNLMALSGCVMAKLIEGNPKAGIEGIGVGSAVAVGLATGIICGAINGILVAKSKCVSLVITLGLSSAYYGLSLIITQGRVMSFTRHFEPIRQLRIGGLLPITLIAFLILVVITFFLINNTKFGRRIVALGGNEENARLCGIKVDRCKIIAFTISGLYCAIAAIIYASRLDAISASSGTGYETSALTGAIIGGITFDGGRGTISGAFLGAFFMGVLSNAMNVLAVDNFVQTVISGLVIVAAVIISNIEQIRQK